MPDTAEQAVLVGVDFTADRLRILLTDERGAHVADSDWPLPELEEEEAWVWEVGGRIAALFATEGQRRSALAIVVAAPGSVEPTTGRLIHCPTHDHWDGLAMVDALRRHIGAPIGAENRTIAALLAETWQGAAPGVDDALYVSLRSIPTAAVLVAGRVARGARFAAGALPAVPTADGPYDQIDLEQFAGILADSAALLDSEAVVIDGEIEDLDRLVPLLQGVLDEVAPGPQVLRAALGDRAPLVGAIRLARSLAFEGSRRP